MNTNFKNKSIKDVENLFNILLPPLHKERLCENRTRNIQSEWKNTDEEITVFEYQQNTNSVNSVIPYFPCIPCALSLFSHNLKENGRGEEIRIISPSGFIQPEYIDGAKNVLSDWGLNPTEGKYAREQYGRFAGTQEQRIHDLQEALDDPNVKAVLCSRGGYGLAQIIDKIDFSLFQKNPKWLIGFSDITVLHNAISALGICSLHGIMAKHLTELPPDSQSVTQLKNILFGELPAYTIPPHPLNKQGKAKGNLIGGNLSVLMGLRGTRFDLNYQNNILFIEDVGEKPYHIDRMMQNLRLSGVLSQLSGLIVGQFSDLEEDPLMSATIYELIYNAVKEYDIPVCFDFPVGHVDENLPLIVNTDVCLDVLEENVLLSWL